MLLLLGGQENTRKCLIITGLLYQAVPSLDRDALVLSVLLLFDMITFVGTRNLSCGVRFCCPPCFKNCHTQMGALGREEQKVEIAKSCEHSLHICTSFCLCENTNKISAFTSFVRVMAQPLDLRPAN